ncbi:hypothetical protein C8J57DRAFT_105137 [Mycena rebaudengoi]|nr:hypothetical protein C8J57DRAFT_453570 [Mycena rebaudengoi]KAJ7280665.1 hypothetical protein C8J57DRAFT_105137 [Mycena rebaudengoi]
MRQDYWSYIAGHPAHMPTLLLLSLPKAHGIAQTYLEWCSSETLTSNPEVPFPYRHSQDMAAMLQSMQRQSNLFKKGTKQWHYEDTWRSKEEYEAVTGFPVNDLANPDQEHCKLWISLVAKVLVVKYNQSGNVKRIDPAPESKTSALFFNLLDFASFGSFLRYLRRLQELRKTSSSDDHWRDHILRLVKEWEEFNLISTVLLSASAGILALQNIEGIPRTAILISVISSFGTIITGLYCISKYQVRAPEAQDSIQRPSAGTRFNYDQYALTHKGIALVLGLPMALLVWALISFLVGILSFNIVGTETSQGHVSNTAYGVIGVAGVVLLLSFVVMWKLPKLWESEDNGVQISFSWGKATRKVWRSVRRSRANRRSLDVSTT